MGDPVILQRGTVVTTGADGRRTTRPFEDADRYPSKRSGSTTAHNLGAGAAAKNAAALLRAPKVREEAAGYKNGGLVCSPKARKLK